MGNGADAKPPSSNGYKMPAKVGIIYSDVKREYFPTEEQYLTEKEALEDAEKVAAHLKEMGIKPLLYPGNADLPVGLKKDKPDMVINMVGSVKGNEYLASTIPALMELLEIPYTGSGILAESLSYNKFLVCKLLEQHGVPVPRYQLFISHTDMMDTTLRFPVIAKLNEIHGGVEITKDSVSETEKHLRERIEFLIRTYEQPVLVQEFIVGREITAILFEGLNKRVYMAEKAFHQREGKYIFATFEDQWLTHEFTFDYQKFEDSLLKEYVRKAFAITKMADYGKFDVRLDSSGRYYFLDSNSNPAFGPKESDCAIAYILELYGVGFPEMLKRLLINTMKDAAS